MKAIQISHNQEYNVIELERPVAPQAGEVLLKIQYVGFCGSDINTFMGRNSMALNPVIPGHEIGAVIEAVGAGVPETLKPGMVVTCNPYTNCGHCASCRNGRVNACQHNETLGVQRNGAMREYIVLPWQKIIPACGLSTKTCAIIEPMSVGFHAVNRGRVTDIDVVMVIGCGMVGLGAIVRASLRGATVIAADIDDEKLALAKQLGSTYAVNTKTEDVHQRLSELTGGFGPDVVIEAVGSVPTYQMAVNEVAFTGRVVCIGYAKSEVLLQTKFFVQKELDIRGSRNAMPEDFRAVIHYLERGTCPTDELERKSRKGVPYLGRFYRLIILFDNTNKLKNTFMKTKNGSKLVEKKYLVTFILVTSLFALWGFANDITNPMVAAFQTLMEISAAKASMVQFAFYGGYATMAIPAALFIRKYSYKVGVLIGLGLYAVGAFLFIPAAQFQEFTFFCISLYILTFGLAFLETSANPFILSLGSKETSTRRLNLAQAFNPVGSLSGMAVASFIVLPNLISDKRDAAGQIIFGSLSEAEKADIRLHDLAVIRDPYVAIGLVVLVMFIIIALTKMPSLKGENDSKTSARTTLSRLWSNKIYRNGVLAQVLYVAAQIMVWTFIIQYADHLGIDKATAQTYNIVAMSLSLTGRFLGTYIMKYVNQRLLLMIFGVGASVFTFGTICIEGIWGLYSLVCISFFMSIL